MSLHILVTGGAGYIGSLLVPTLLADGHQVTVIDNFLWKQNSLASCCADPGFDIVNGDVRLEETIRPLIAKADVIIPLAALVGAPLCHKDPFAATTTNKDAIALMLRLMGKTQRILMPVTNSGYGVGEPGKYCTEETPLRPISRYGIDKVAAERMILDHGNAISFRLATVFGASPRMRTDLLVNDFVYRAVFDRAVVLFEAHFKRNYLHVQDAAAAFMHSLKNYGKMKGRPYNVGLSEANLSKWELCQAIQRHVPRFTFLISEVGKDPDQRNYIVSNARIEATGFQPAVGLDAGLRELVKAYQVIRRQQFSNV